MSTNEASLSAIVELRQYTLHPGGRDTLIALFDRAFIESQESAGTRVIGQFRDIDDPDRFVWLRGFTDMTTRAAALAAFYGGPVWKANRDAANATMIDSDNVLLLHPARLGSGFSPDLGPRAPEGASGSAPGLVTATIYSLAASAASAMLDYFDRRLAPALTDSGATILGVFVTDPSPNTFPALPIRENETVFVWFAGFGDGVPADVAPSDGDAPGITTAPRFLRLTPHSAVTADRKFATVSSHHRPAAPCLRHAACHAGRS